MKYASMMLKIIKMKRYKELGKEKKLKLRMMKKLICQTRDKESNENCLLLFKNLIFFISLILFRNNRNKKLITLHIN